jgi:hypothetical protein
MKTTLSSKARSPISFTAFVARREPSPCKRGARAGAASARAERDGARTMRRKLSRFLRVASFLCAVSLMAACTRSAKPPAVLVPPPVADIHRLPMSSEAPTITSAPEVASFRLIFERTLGRAGFRVLHAGDATAGALSVALIGDGSGTSGAAGGVSYAKQTNKLDATLSRDGRLLKELHSGVSYTTVRSEDETVDAFGTRAAAASTQGYEFMAADLTNQLVATLRGGAL